MMPGMFVVAAGMVVLLMSSGRGGRVLVLRVVVMLIIHVMAFLRITFCCGLCCSAVAVTGGRTGSSPATASRWNQLLSVFPYHAPLRLFFFVRFRWKFSPRHM